MTLQWFEFVPTEYDATIAGNVNGEGGWGATMIFSAKNKTEITMQSVTETKQLWKQMAKMKSGLKYANSGLKRKDIFSSIVAGN